MKSLLSIFLIVALLHTSLSAPTDPVEKEDPNPEVGENGEDDITWRPPQFKTKQGLVDEEYRWPDATLVYELTDQFTDDQIAIIQEAHHQISSQTCIQFREKTDNDEDYVSVLNPSSKCNSAVGKKGGEQSLRLANACFTSAGWARIAHEFIHALGVDHEQNREDRDQYVTIHWDNIIEESKHNFKIGGQGDVSSFGVAYDYDSVMHYGRTFFQKHAGDTITPVKKGARIGQRDHLSKGDIKRLNAMYHC